MLKPAFIDLSHHNTIPEGLIETRKAGILGVIHKATEGASSVDRKLKARYDLARQAGMLWGVYHFMRPGSVRDQIDNFLRALDALQVADRDTLVCLDYEVPGIGWRKALEWLDYVSDVMERDAVLYSGHTLREEFASEPAPPELTSHRLWVPRYNSQEPELPKGFARWWAWQYSQEGKIAGVNPPTDLNAYAGTAEQLMAEWAGRSVAPPAPAPAPTRSVTITVAAPADVEVIVKQETIA